MAKTLMILLNVFAYFSYIFGNVYCKCEKFDNLDRETKPPVDLLTVSTLICLILISFIQISLAVMIKRRMALIPEYTKEHKLFKKISSRAIYITTLMVILFFLRYIHYLVYIWGLLDKIFENNEYMMTGESAVNYVSNYSSSSLQNSSQFRS